MPMPHAGGFTDAIRGLHALEDAGLDVVTIGEAYTFDAVSQLGFVAASTSRVQLASSILNVYTRTPVMLAMTAAGLDHVSNGRFALGLGSSGPQVVEGFHGVPFDAPLGRTREVVDVCRRMWRAEEVGHHAHHEDGPLTPDRVEARSQVDGSPGPRIPLTLAALGPRNIALAAELFEAWQPIFLLPELAREVFSDALAEGLARRDPALPALEIIVDTRLFISEDAGELEEARDRVRRSLALYLGGMGSRGRNFYHQLAGRLGFAAGADRVQKHFLAGRHDEAAAAVPAALVDGISLVGPPGHVADRLTAFADAGVAQLNLAPLGRDEDERFRHFAQVRALVDRVGAPRAPLPRARPGPG